MMSSDTESGDCHLIQSQEMMSSDTESGGCVIWYGAWG